MKMLYLIKKQYSRYFVREVVVIVQLLLMLWLFTPILARLVNLLAVDQLGRNIKSPAMFFQADDYYMRSEFVGEEYAERFDEIEACPMVKSVGYTGAGGYSMEEAGVSVYFYSDALIDNISMPTIENVSGTQGIPVIINREMSQIYGVGDIIEIDNLTFSVSGRQPKTTFVVAGIDSGSSNYYYRFRGGASNVTLESIGVSSAVGNEYCMVAIDGFEIVPLKDIDPSCLLFIEEENEQTKTSINNAIGELGFAEALSTMRLNSLHYILFSNPLPFISALLMVLLCVASVCSYTYISVMRMRENFAIYYICGMDRKKSLCIIILALSMILIIAFLISITILPIAMDVSDLIGYPYAFSIILMLFFIAAIAAVTQYGNIDPITLMRKGD